MFKYRAFGFAISSDIELAELWPEPASDAAAASADIVIRTGDVPLRLSGRTVPADDYQVAADNILLTIPSVARYLAQAGKCLVVEAMPDADPLAVRLFLKGSGLAAIFHQRGLFPLHASAVEHKGGCVLFLGDSGAGKSTLAGLLARRGYRILSDDVVVTRVAADGALLAEPSLPVLKLWPESLDVTGLENANAPFEAIDYRKHRIAMPETFLTTARPIRRLYFLQWQTAGSAPAAITSLSPFEALVALRSNVYRDGLIGALDREEAYVSFFQNLLANADAHTFGRLNDLSQAEAQIDVLTRHLAGL